MLTSTASDSKCSVGFAKSHQIFTTCHGNFGSVTPTAFAISCGDGWAHDSSLVDESAATALQFIRMQNSASAIGKERMECIRQAEPIGGAFSARASIWL